MGARIRFGEAFEPLLPEERLPPESLVISGSENHRRQSFQVYIVKDAFGQIWGHVNENPRVESGGVLVGHPFRDFDGLVTFVVVVTAIRHDSHNRSVGHFTVGPSEIAGARSKWKKDHPGLISVGWYHSHPGHGLFLSPQDMTIMHSIYNASWHLALVVDPQRGDPQGGKEIFALFRGPKGEKLPGWLELGKEPISLKAISKYNYAQELLTQGESKRARSELVRIQAWVESRPDMAYWKEKEGYRDVQELVIQIPTDNSDGYSERTSQVPSALGASEDTLHSANDLGISERYDEAKKVLDESLRQQPPNSAGLSKAFQIFEWIDCREPNYEDVSLYINVIRQIQELEQQHRSARPSRNLLDGLFQKLVELLRGGTG
jgi:proteasome lid subunit RPN8/RPN11